MATEDIRKLEEWERVVVASLVQQRQRLIQEAQAAIDALNEALTKLAEEWTGEEGSRFDGNTGGEIRLVREIEEPKAEEPDGKLG